MNSENFFRLQKLRMLNTQYGYDMDEQRERMNKIKKRHENGTAPRAVTSFNLFQTPVPIVEKMIACIDSFENKRVLEPSAGLGRIYNGFIHQNPKESYLVEYACNLCGELYTLIEDKPNTILKQGDFLQMDETTLNGKFDIILMNPPFKMGTDIVHINHAKKLLNTGGILVALCYDGVYQNKHLKPIATTWQKLPANSFKESGTRADTVLLTFQN